MWGAGLRSRNRVSSRETQASMRHTAHGSARGRKEGAMRAIVYEKYGSPDVLELRDIDKPSVTADGVRSCFLTCPSLQGRRRQAL